MKKAKKNDRIPLESIRRPNVKEANTTRTANVPQNLNKTNTAKNNPKKTDSATNITDEPKKQNETDTIKNNNNKDVEIKISNSSNSDIGDFEDDDQIFSVRKSYRI